MSEYIVGGVPMDLPLILGAGAAKHPSKLLSYMRADAPIGAVITGSYTPNARDGNLETPQQWPETWEEFEQQQFMLNSWGMPNVGFAEAAQALYDLEPIKPIIVSIAGFSVEDYVHGVQVFDSHPNVSAIELNFGCPNAHDKKTVPISYDLDDMRTILDAIQALWPSKPLWVKLSPYATKEQIMSLAERTPRLDLSQVPTVSKWHPCEARDLIQKYPHVKAIVFANTLPNVIYRKEDGTPVTAPNKGQAGMSGRLLKDITIDCFFQMRTGQMSSYLDLIASGGILSGWDIQDYTLAGAKGFQCTSGPDMYGDGLKFFSSILQEDVTLHALSVLAGE